jgi:hypothetical protein
VAWDHKGTNFKTFFFESVFMQLLKETAAVLIANKGSVVTEEA